MTDTLTAVPVAGYLLEHTLVQNFRVSDKELS